jgi:hypothetical protein
MTRSGRISLVGFKHRQEPLSIDRCAPLQPLWSRRHLRAGLASDPSFLRCDFPSPSCRCVAPRGALGPDCFDAAAGRTDRWGREIMSPTLSRWPCRVERAAARRNGMRTQMFCRESSTGEWTAARGTPRLQASTGGCEPEEKAVQAARSRQAHLCCGGSLLHAQFQPRCPSRCPSVDASDLQHRRVRSRWRPLRKPAG